jgi:hypothetical protein
MPVSLEFLRGVLGLFSVLFAHMAGRVLVDVRRGRVKQSRFTAWVLRALVCAAAMIFPMRAVDRVAIAVWVLDIIAFGAGVWVASRARPAEDLSRTIFPE